MHPGPVNRGVELSPEVADGPYSVILDQVANGVAVRMAVLYLLAREQGGMSLLLRGGRVVDPANRIDAVQDVLIADGRIVRVGASAPGARGDAACWTSPARWCARASSTSTCTCASPGLEYKETIASGTRAAAAGGFTAVACMANTAPVNDNRAVTDYILAKARVEGAVRVYPIGAVTRGLKGETLAEMAELAEGGCVAFSDDGKCVMNAEVYRRAMEYALPFGIAHHQPCRGLPSRAGPGP